MPKTYIACATVVVIGRATRTGGSDHLSTNYNFKLFVSVRGDWVSVLSEWRDCGVGVVGS